MCTCRPSSEAPRGPQGRAFAALLLLVVASPSAELSGAGAGDLAILDRLALPAESQALALSPDGRRAAVALPAGAGERTVLRLHSVDAVEPTTIIKIPGLVRDLLFSDDGVSIYVLQHRPAKRHDGEAFLLRVGLDSLKIEDRLRLPPTARAIEPWRERRSLLVPARNEIRTITLPLLRSGPLFRVLGENLCLSAIGGTRMLVGQDAAALVVDLSDRQGREGLPVRQRIATPAPVVSFDLDAGARRATARLADGSELSLNLDPATPVASAAAAAREIAPPLHQRDPLPANEPQQVEAPAPEDPPTPQQVEAPAPGDPPTPQQAAPAAGSDTARAPAARGAAQHVQVRGTLRDAGADLVISVVFLGPDNLLREAARVRPGGDGRWVISGLPAGRYRVQLDAGGGRVLITEPPFRTLEIGGAPAATLTADFRVAGAL